MSTEKNQTSIPPEEMRFDLTMEEAMAYLKLISPHGVKCTACNQQSWGVPIFAGKDVNGKQVQAVFPDGVSDSSQLFPAGNDVKSNVMINSARNYAFVCTNCGHQIRFLAGMVAARAALARRSVK